MGVNTYSGADEPATPMKSPSSHPSGHDLARTAPTVHVELDTGRYPAVPNPPQRQGDLLVIASAVTCRRMREAWL